MEYLEVYTESTPNPAKLKFVTSRVLLPQMIYESKSNAEFEESPLAKHLYQSFPYLTEVFISNNFITVTKHETDEEWFELTPYIKDTIKKYLQDNNPVVTEAFIEQETKRRKAKEKATANDSPEEKIIGLIHKYVKPAVETDGGNIEFDSFQNGTVTVLLQGACSGCPSSTATLKDGIEAMLKRMVPEVNEVVAIND